jgi:hypothetical protein
MACMGLDRQVRIFRFATGKLYRKYDESLAVLSEMQQARTLIRCSRLRVHVSICGVCLCLSVAWACAYM